MAKDKKKSNKKDKKSASSASSPVSSLKALSQNPLLADVVAAALVATAAALKDSKKARKLAEDAGDEVTALSKAGADRGSALWKLAVDVGRGALEAFNDEAPARKRTDTTKKPKRTVTAKKPKRQTGVTKPD